MIGNSLVCNDAEALGHPRVQGALLAAGGIGEAALGAGLLLTPEPTGLTKIGGVALIGHGADLTAAGLKQFWMAQSVQTFTSQIVSRGLITTGVPSPYANLAGELTEIGVAAVPIGIAGKVGAVGQSAKILSSSVVSTWPSPAAGRQIINGIEYTIHSLARIAPRRLTKVRTASSRSNY